MQIAKLTRRDLLKVGAGTVLALGAGKNLFALAAKAADQTMPRGKADACIFLWLGGGAAHIDTFDPKVVGDGKKKPGSYYPSIETAIPGVRVCEHLRRTAPLLDRCIPIRSLFHPISSQHGAATNLVHTGRTPSGTVSYPSIGSIASHELGPKTDEVPTYVVMGYPNIARDPGFLGARYGYVYLTQIETGPNGLMRAPDVDVSRQNRREMLLSRLRADFLGRNRRDEVVQAQIEVSKKGFHMAGPQFLNVFDLKREPAPLREAYGGEFGQRCLLARRLVQSGVRFVEVSFNLNFLNGHGWDTHNKGILKQHLLIQDLDQALSTLLQDLEQNRLLDTTLVVLATEFGRPPEFDSGGGRGHHSQAFSALLAGGGLRTGQAIGVTDELGKTAVERPVSIPDFHATIHAALGIDPSKNLFAGNRPVPITDHGQPIAEVFS
ncbi:DUF1501 domain-containing protein [Acidobacteria bacterium AH-259-A15]|nr:DUF1501 domain-containing protein [Acidobacteria bacterium AH-259-A15]